MTMLGNNIELERDCGQCGTGVVMFGFDLQGREPDVGIMSGYATLDYTLACNDCGDVPTLTDDERVRLEEEATEGLQGW